MDKELIKRAFRLGYEYAQDESEIERRRKKRRRILALSAILALGGGYGLYKYRQHKNHENGKSSDGNALNNDDFENINSQIVNDMHNLLSFQRNFAYRNKAFAGSISEMGDGTGIGKDGFVLQPSLWRARLDGGDQPAIYHIDDPVSGTRKYSSGYRFGIFPSYGGTGEPNNFSSIMVAAPSDPSSAGSCFVADIGPVNMKNDFSFDLEWPVYQLTADKAVLDALNSGISPDFGTLRSRFEEGGDLSKYLVRKFGGLYYPKK